MRAKCIKEKIFDFIIIILALIGVTMVMLNINWIQGLDGDNAPQTYAIYTLVGRALHNGELPLWNPYIWGGISSIGAPITEAFYPINWILCYLFYDYNTGIVSYAIITVNLIFHISVYFCGCYFLLRKIGVKQVYAAMLSLLSISCFSFAGFLTWIVYFDGFCWLPFLTLAAIRLIESRDKKKIYYNTIVLGILFAVEAMISVSLMLTITATFIVVLFCVRVIESKGKELYQLLKLVRAAILGIMLSMPMIIETVQFLLNSARYVDDTFLFGMSKISFDSFVAHRVTLQDAESIFSVLPVRSWLSVGGVLFLLSVIGIFGKSENKQYVHRWSIVGIVFCILYCFGFVVTDFVYYIPFLNNLRETYMYGCVINFYTTVLAGYGINVISEIEKNDKLIIKISNGKVVVGLLIVFLIYNVLPHKYSSVYQILIVILLVVFLVVINMKSINKSKSLGILLVATGLGVYCFLRSFGTGYINELQAIDKIEMINNYNNRAFSEFVNEKNSRIIQVGSSAYPLNQGAVLGIKEETNYFNPSSEMAIKCNMSMDFVKRSQLHNVKYWLINTNNDESFVAWWDAAVPDIAYSGKIVSMMTSWDAIEPSDIMVYESGVTYGDAWVVSDWDYYTEAEEENVFAWINSIETELDKKVLVNKDKVTPITIEKLKNIDTNNGKYFINEVNHSNNRIRYEVSSEKEAILVTAEMYEQGWSVYVNGNQQEVINVDYSNRAVIIPAGDSVVEFIYRPNGFIGGVIIQLISIFILFIVFIRLIQKEKQVEFLGQEH